MSDPEELESGVVAQTIDTQTAEVAEDIGALLQFFNQMDATEPLIRLVTAAGLTGVSILLLLLSRFLISRRLKRMEALPDNNFKPLRWQAQDLMSSEDMKRLWCTLWRWLGWLVAVFFGVFALIGVLMISKWTMTLAARLIVMVVTAVIDSDHTHYPELL